MGWKNLKEAYNIKHHVTENSHSILIGTDYVRNIVSICRETGALRENSTFPGFAEEYYPALAQSSAEERLGHIHRADTFKASIPVYTFQDGLIIKKHCENPGYPNVTHDGFLITASEFSTNRHTVVGWAKRDLRSWMKALNEQEAELLKQLDTLRSSRKTARSRLNALLEVHPDPTEPTKDTESEAAPC